MELYSYLPKEYKVYTNCRKMCKPDSQTVDNSMHDVSENSSNIDFIKSSLEADTVNSSEDRDESWSVRDIELKELLMGLKEKFSSLVGNDSLKLRILTIINEYLIHDKQ